MPDSAAALEEIARARSDDPLAPVTVLVPSHAAGLQMRRRLAEIRPFAGVRFETLPRIAELLGAGSLAATGRRPLARPIGDYVAEVVARQSRGALESIADLPGYARVLRHIFRRLRRGGIATGAETTGGHPGHFREILRLYRLYREQTSGFYDEEDLLDAAAEAVSTGRAGSLTDLGTLYVVPPGPLTASGTALLEALRETAPACHNIDESPAAAEPSFIIAPDPASEVREVVRDVLTALDRGIPIEDIAVLHGAGESYGRLLREAFAAAQIPCVPTPGIPLIETRAGRGVLALARLPGLDFARTAVMDFLTVAPIRQFLPASAGGAQALVSAWARISREAGISKGAERWPQRLSAYIADREKAARKHRELEEDSRAEWEEEQAERAQTLRSVIQELIRRLEPLQKANRAADFITAFQLLITEYVDRDADALEAVDHEIEQLGTVDAVEGDFTLDTFADALDANLRLAYHRPSSLGDGVFVADYRQAGGLQFQHVALCGAFEGALPAGPGVDAIIPDTTWQALKERFPHIEDAGSRIERARLAADRAVASASGTLTWTCPRFEPGGTREYYPSHYMVGAVQSHANGEGDRVTATMLRAGGLSIDRLRGIPSPMTGTLRGPQLDRTEGAIRQAAAMRQAGRFIDDKHPRWRPVTMLQSRRSQRFTEWDGNLSSLRDDAWLDLQQKVSPTSLEAYALCGFKYFARSLLRLKTVEEPEEREMMDPATRGSLIHQVLDRFFREQRERGRPAVNEPWTNDDLHHLLRLLSDAINEAKERGLTGLDVYAEHEYRTIVADLALFLRKDTAFRQRTGAVPSEFEVNIPESEIGGITLRGIVDRIDRTPDGRRAWVIDYKTGSAYPFRGAGKEPDPFLGGTKLQLPAYLAAADDAQEAKALYWFITRKGDFEEIDYDQTPGNTEKFSRTLQSILAGIRAGSFPPVPNEEDEFRGGFDNCRFCEFDRICSRRRDYEFAAKQEDEDVSPWLGVGATARETAS